jgi:protocatechuate 3,4-dioxygenase alpha subunit
MPPMTQTPSQTVGPFFSLGLIRRTCNVLVNTRTSGVRIRIEGRVFDGAGQPVDDALVEIWQAGADGRYRQDPDFGGFGRCGTDAAGTFFFDTIKPGVCESTTGARAAPHVNVIVFARGLLVHAFTRIYFSDDRLDDDPVLSTVDAARRGTLIARRAEASTSVTYRWDIRLQGDRETVFFDA